MRICLFALLSICSPLLAQTTLSLQAATPLATATADAGAASTFQVTPAGTVIAGSPNSVFQVTSQSPSPDYLSATTIVYPTLSYQGGAGFNFFERANVRGSVQDEAGTSASAVATGATFGSHEVLATFSAAPGTVGHVKVSWRNNATTVGASGTTGARVDVGDDGVFEVDQAAAGEFSIPFTFGASGQVVVRVGNECRSRGDGTSATVYTWTEMWVGFQPDLTATCTFTNYGQGCAGVQAAGNELVVGNTRTIFMLATGCYPGSPAIVAIGSQQLALPLLNGCSLLSNAESLALVAADGAGNATASWSIPVTVVGTTFVQFLPIADVGGLLAIRASNGVRVDCTN
ncbi:MAG: hypothetical protein R3F29_00740 [Planctomycetota bacterium]